MPVIVSTAQTPRVIVVGQRSTAGVSVASTSVVTVVGKGAQGPAGPEGPVGPAGGDVIVLPAATDLGGHRVVRSNSGFAGYADAYDPDHGDDVLGVTLGAAVAEDDVQIQVGGVVTEPSWSWVPEEPIFLGADGLPTQAVPTDAAFLLVIGFSETPTSMRVRIESPIYTDN